MGEQVFWVTTFSVNATERISSVIVLNLPGQPKNCLPVSRCGLCWIQPNGFFNVCDVVSSVASLNTRLGEIPLIFITPRSVDTLITKFKTSYSVVGMRR